MAFNLNTSIANLGGLLKQAAGGANPPASVTTALNAWIAAVQATEAALPDLAETLAIDAINLGLSKVGLSALDPEIDALAGPAITAVENLLLSKLGLAATTGSVGTVNGSASNAEVQTGTAAALNSGAA